MAPAPLVSMAPPLTKLFPAASMPARLKANVPRRAALENADEFWASMLPLAVALLSKRMTSARWLEITTKSILKFWREEIRVALPWPFPRIAWVPVKGTLVKMPPPLLMSSTPPLRVPPPFAWKRPAIAKKPKRLVPEKAKAYVPFKLALVNPALGIEADCDEPPQPVNSVIE